MTIRALPRRCLLGMIATFAIGTLAACGDDATSDPADPDPVATDPTDPTDPTIGTDPSSGTWPDVESGADPASQFVTVEDRLVVTLGGDIYRRTEHHGPGGFRAPAAVPGPPTPTAWEVAELTEQGRDQLAERMGALGFLAPPPDYGDYMATDTSPFRLVVRTDGQAWEHELMVPEDSTGDDEADAARHRLTTFVDYLDSIDAELGDEVGRFEPYVPTQWRVENLTYSAGEPVDWPFDTAPIEGCTDFAADDPTADGTDGASGRYVADREVYDVSPLFPWQGC